LWFPTKRAPPDVLPGAAIGFFPKNEQENPMSTKTKILTGLVVFSGILMLISIGLVVDVTAGCIRAEAGIAALSRRLEQADKTACESIETKRKILLYKKNYGEKLQEFPKNLIARTFGFPKKDLSR
jgi:hypothetical protein